MTPTVQVMHDEWNYPGLRRYMQALEAWFYEHLRMAHANAIMPDGRWRVCLGMLVYGDYVDTFLKYCLPSLMAPGNIKELNDPLLLIHTDEVGAETLRLALVDMTEFARVEIHVIPPFIFDMVHDNKANKYWILGAAHNLHMQQAKYRAHAYHMLMPDHVYGMGYFENMARLATFGAKAIVQGGLSCVLEDVAPALMKRNGHLTNRQLNALALDHLHRQMGPLIMNGHNDYPGCSFLLLVGEHAAQIVCPHMSIAYLGHEVLMQVPLRLPNTVDGQLPWFVPEEFEPYIPSADDGMNYIELSLRSKPFGRGQRCTLPEFVARYWTSSFCERGYERFSNLTTMLPFPDGYIPPIEPMTEAQIDAVKQTVRHAISHLYKDVREALPPLWKIDPITRAAQLLRAKAFDNGMEQVEAAE